MRYFYFDQIADKLHIVPDLRDDCGVLLGSVSDADYEKANHKVIAQSLMSFHKLQPKGLDIEIEYGPSLKP